MALIVQKYGGAVLADIDKIRTVAQGIAELYSAGNQIVVVVSAMGQVTDDLVRLAYSVAKEPTKREMDMLLSVGERISMSLMAMAIEETGMAKAISYTGSQVGIITDTKHTEARIVEIRSMRLKEALDAGKIVVIAGFQGVSLEKEITTLGRGGSDTTAVAIAAALGADRCDLIKEYPGIFSADPTIIPEAIPIPQIDYKTAKGMCLGGARVLKDACVEMAARYGIELRVGNKTNATIVSENAADPFFNMTFLEGLAIYRITAKIDIPDFLGTEIITIKDTSYLIREADSSCLPEEHLILENNDITRIVFTGDNQQEFVNLIDNELEIEENIITIIGERTVKIYLKTANPRLLIFKLHQKMLDIFSQTGKSDGGQ